MLIIGDGPLRHVLEDRLELSEIASRIRFLGAVSDPRQLLPAIDIFLLPTLMEGISLAVAEAMQHGVPVVTSDVGGLPEQMGSLHGQPPVGGFLIPLQNDETDEVAAYAKAVAALVQDPLLRHSMGAAAAEHIRATFDRDVTLSSLFAEIAAAHARPVRDLSGKTTPNPASYFGISHMLMEEGENLDSMITQPQKPHVRQLSHACRAHPADEQARHSNLATWGYCNRAAPPRPYMIRTGLPLFLAAQAAIKAFANHEKN